ncbi:MAG: hypothetical protein A4E48_00808 [Methanosaeta sp. PtaU1.Bin060]|jgi:hypothetical protein|nr:MAG: hypothetical protein A4E48_00808 [Methanosaeta sp. PtaU1.Bin060]
MPEGVVQFEVVVQSLNEMKSRVIWPGSEGPWIDGRLEDMMVHFTYAAWTAYNMKCAMSLALTSRDENLGKAVSEMMTKMITAFGGMQMAEIRLTPEALDALRRDRLEP